MENRMLSDEILLALIKKNSGGGGQSAIHVKGVTTTVLTDGCDTNPITINGESYTAVDGDLVTYQSKEFLFNGTIWQELGDVSEVMAIIEKILDDIADEFDATTTYAIDDFVIKDSVLYKCISAHTGAWDANDFITTTVVDEIASKQNVLTAGKYININANNEISVDPVVPNEAFTYTFKVVDNNSVEIIKTVDDAVVFDEVYSCWDPVAQQQTDVNETFDDAINIHVYMSGERSYTLLIASDTHEAGFKQSTPWYERNTFVETFSTVDHSGEKLITKSDMDVALADKQNALTAGDYIQFDGNEISVNREIPNETVSYEFKTKGTSEPNIAIIVTKRSNGSVVWEREYQYLDVLTPIIIDDVIKFGYQWVYAGQWTYEMLVASDSHAVGYRQSWGYLETRDYTEDFSLIDNTGLKLVIKSEMDAALADKADKSAVKNEFLGTLEEWNALTIEQRKAYDTYQIKGDYTEGGRGIDDYTDTEQKVGTWFGDDLYRKSYYFENVSKGAHSLGIQNLDKIIKVEGGYIERFVDPSVSYGFVPFPYSNGAFTSDNFTGVECNITNGTVIFNWGSNHDPLQKDAVMTVYYTKTA